MNKKTLIIAATVLAAILIAGYYLFLREPNYDALVDEYFIPYPDELTSNTRSDELDTTDQSLKTFMAAYKQKRYEEALEGFNQYLLSKPHKYEIKFYRGIIYLKNKNASLAVIDFEDVAVLNNSYKDRSEWYLGLAYLKNNQKKQAADLFYKIAASNSPYSEKANEILNKIPYKPYLNKEIEKI